MKRLAKARALRVAEHVVSTYGQRTTEEEDALIAEAFAIIDQRLKPGEGVSDPDVAGALFQRKLRGLPHEVFACLFLDTRHRVLAYEELFRGNLDGSEVHPREIVKRCLAHNAASVIFGHNHPSGNPEPSAADRAVTARLKQALALVEVRVLDHFVIGEGAPTSMARKGMI